MKLIKWMIYFLSAAVLTACVNNMPQAEYFPPATQKKALTAQHWSLIAEDAAKRTKLALEKHGASPEQRIYVADDAKFDFDRAFRKYLILHLINQGLVVSTTAKDAIAVKYESQLIRHGYAIDPETSGYQPGMLVAGVAGFWVLRDVFSNGSTFSKAAGSTAAAGAYDSYRYLNPRETPIELILTTSITHDDRYLMLNSDAYYIEKGEEFLFQRCNGRRTCREVK